MTLSKENLTELKDKARKAKEARLRYAQMRAHELGVSIEKYLLQRKIEKEVSRKKRMLTDKKRQKAFTEKLKDGKVPHIPVEYCIFIYFTSNDIQREVKKLYPLLKNQDRVEIEDEFLNKLDKKIDTSLGKKNLGYSDGWEIFGSKVSFTFFVKDTKKAYK